VNRFRIQPKVAVELETVSLRLPAQLVRTVEQYAEDFGGSTDPACVITEAIEIALRRDAEFQKTLSARPAVSMASSRHSVAAVPTYRQSTLTPAGAQPGPPASSSNTPVFTSALAATYSGLSLFPRQ
jgi:hypothetical protein